MTAVEFLMKFCLNDLPIEQWNKYNGLFEQAKEMEKQQKIEFAKDFWNWAKGGKWDESDVIQYYNETYGSKGSDEHIVDTNEMTFFQTEISDEEIEKAARNYDNGDIYGPPLVNFEQGAFWYRQQLKQRQCNK